MVLTGCLSLILGSVAVFLSDIFNHANLALISLMPHAPGLMTVQPGQVDNPGNGWGWLFDGPTSRTTRLTYTPSDPGSDKRTWAADSAQ